MAQAHELLPITADAVPLSFVKKGDVTQLPEELERSADIQVANHAGELQTPLAHVSEGIETYQLSITELQRRVAEVQKSIIKRWKERNPYDPDPVKAQRIGALRPLMKGERPFVLCSSHIIKIDGQRYISARIYGVTNLASLKV